MSRAAVATLAAALVLAPHVSAAADAPPWLVQAARLTLAPNGSGANAIVLVDDVSVTVGDDGRITTRRTYAARIVTRGGARPCSRVAHR